MSDWNKIHPLETEEYNKERWISIKSNPELRQKNLEFEKKRRNSPKRKEYIRNWKLQNKKHISEYNAQYKEDHPDYWKQEKVLAQKREYDRIYNRQYPEKLLARQEKYLKKQGSIFNLLDKDYKRVLSSWSKTIRKRDQDSCKVCGSNENLHAHHILYRQFYPHLSFNINNGITLCNNCHNESHGNKLGVRR